MINILRNVMGKSGIQLRRLVFVNLRGKTIHPLEMVYGINNRAGSPTILMNIPVSKCRTQIWNTLEENKNPFVKTIIDYGKNKGSDYGSSAVKAYYESYVPENAGDVLRLKSNEALKKIPAFGYTLPWDNQHPDEIIRIREKDAYNENRQEGKSIGLSAGYTDFGPVEIKKGEIEFKRLIKIYGNIKERGYKEKWYLNDGGIKGYFLAGDDDDWCFIVKSGKHRAYALSALGYENIPVIVDCNMAMVKQVSNLRFWPQVRTGLFSESEARTLANNILNIESYS